MHSEYINQINTEDLYCQWTERTSDVQTSPAINILLLGTWAVICLIGFAVIFLAKETYAGIAIIAVPTFFGMVIKPTFALCLLMLVLPTGAGVGYAGIGEGEGFSLNRGVGVAIAVSFLLNIMVSRPRLNIRNKALWIMVSYIIWVFLVSLSSSFLGLELRRFFTQFQLLALVFVVYWIIETNDERTFLWALRSYLIGSLGTILLTFVTGAAIVSMEESKGRYTATAGTAIDANMLGTLVAMAFLTAIYLLVRDKQIIWRVTYLITIPFMFVMMFRTGSRGALIAFTFTMLSPLIFIRQILRKPALLVLLLMIIILASGSAAFLIKGGGLEESVAHRFTDVQYAKKSLDYRISLVKESVKSALSYPTGTTYNEWLNRTGLKHYPHSDIFFALGVYGIPAASLFMLFVIMMLLTVKRIPLGVEKLYARAVLTLLLITGLNIVQLFQKHFWIFLAVVMATERISLAMLMKQQTGDMPTE